MRIITCIKEIQNPEIPSSVFRINEEKMEVIPLGGMAPVISPYDEHAIEAALRLRDAGLECEVMLLSIGPASIANTVKKGLALGADMARIIAGESAGDYDRMAVAGRLADEIRSTDDVGAVFCGRQAADWDAGIVGPALGEYLGWPVVTLASNITFDGEYFHIERACEDSREQIKVRPPCVVTVTNELGDVRKATLRETMRSAKKPLVTTPWHANGPDEGDTQASVVKRTRLYIPKSEVRCEYVAGGAPEEVAAMLVERLEQSGII